MTPDDLVPLVAKFWPESEWVTAVAVAGGESDWDDKAHYVNDHTGDDSWGLFQINTKGGLWPELQATYGFKSKVELLDPHTNVQVAHDKWLDRGWQPWGAYKDGGYRRYGRYEKAQTAVDRFRKAHAEPTVTTELWWPKATKDLFPSCGSFTGGPPKGLIHKTAGSSYAGARSVYATKGYPPHFTATYETRTPKMYQHMPIDQAACALANKAGGVQTNRDHVIQIEIVGFDADPIAKPMLDFLGEWMRWVEANAGVKRKAVAFELNPGNDVRMDGPTWDAYDGWCGHQHCPENDHQDPGPIDIAYLLSVGVPVPVVTSEEEDMYVRDINGKIGTKDTIYLVVGRGLLSVGDPKHLQQLTGAKDVNDRSMVRNCDASNPIWKLAKVT